MNDSAVEAGTIVSGFRVERRIGTGDVGTVYEAIQVSLGRAVALRLVGAHRFDDAEALAAFDRRQHLVASLHHPSLVPFYEFGEWDGGRFIATRLIRGTSLQNLHRDAITPGPEAVESLTDALATAHAAGLTHGRVLAQNILVEANGRAYLTDMGLRRGGSVEADASALADAVSRARERAISPGGRKARTWLIPAVVAAVMIIAVVLALGGGSDLPAPAPAAPPPAQNTRPLGSDLVGSSVEPLGCVENPGPNTPACTLSQVTLEGGELIVERAGVIRDWVVRGASGQLALQVIRQRGERSFVAGFSQPEQFDDPAPHASAAEIEVRPGDRLGIGLGPGATVGVDSTATASALTRWDGILTGDPRRPNATVPGVELMLRADIEYGEQASGPPQLTGPMAEAAPPGRQLTEIHMPLLGGDDGRVVLIELPDEIAIDVVRGRRLARLAVPDADPDGHLLSLTRDCGPQVPGAFCLRWRNPGNALPLEHEYIVRRDGTLTLVG